MTPSWKSSGIRPGSSLPSSSILRT
jgi:hypothetical protein